jgi:hypothetical protein
VCVLVLQLRQNRQLHLQAGAIGAALDGCPTCLDLVIGRVLELPAPDAMNSAFRGRHFYLVYRDEPTAEALHGDASPNFI